MPSKRSNLADFNYFLAITRYRDFRRTGLEMGVSASVLSHALKRLEARVCVRLLNRANRSVTLTAAGKELRDAIEGPFGEIASAVEGLNCFRDTPAARILLNVVADAATLLLGPVMPFVVDRYTDVELDIVASNRLIDVVGSGVDAGIRDGSTVPEDMIVERLFPDLGVRPIVSRSQGSYIPANASTLTISTAAIFAVMV